MHRQGSKQLAEIQVIHSLPYVDAASKAEDLTEEFDNCNAARQIPIQQVVKIQLGKFLVKR
jgi:hypothetical protein